ncbi:MAG: VWA domain-containing protein, partial [Gammaproteobacteria bacterium]|nr:VWA domain-containing protein [Gammaproteobacteria bacterium]
MKKLNIHLPSLVTAALYTLMAGQSALADDTEVLIGPGGQAWATPNVLFIMDTSGSMGSNIAGDTPTATDPSRLSIVQGVFNDLMTTNSGFNVGLMRFSNNGSGGYFVSPMQELNANTRAGIIAASDAFTAGGNTPLSETLYEATRYYRGMSVDYGDSSAPGTNHPDVVSGGNYISPITSQCQRNFV